MRDFYKALLAFFFGILIINDSTALSDKVSKAKDEKGPFQQVNLLEAKSQPSAPDKVAGVFQLNKVSLLELHKERPQSITLEIPYKGRKLRLDLLQNKPVSSDAFLKTASGKTVPIGDDLHYNGVASFSGKDGQTKNLAALSLYKDKITAHILGGDLQYSLASPEGTDNYHLYSEKGFDFEGEFACEAKKLPVKRPAGPAPLPGKKQDSCKNVDVFFEADFEMFRQLGSVARVSEFVRSFFNVVNTIYEEDDIYVSISGLKVWDQTDPYRSIDSRGELLQNFRNTSDGGDGDIAHLLSAREEVTGGVAFVGSLCEPDFNYGFAGIETTYEEYPAYSQTVFFTSHEIGHSLGSRHTHWCGWEEGALDDCFEVEEASSGQECDPGPTPEDGGTIMSYCHLESEVGINLARGFETPPKDTIQSTIEFADCLEKSPIPSAEIADVGLSDICESSENEVLLEAEESAKAFYQWRRNGEPIPGEKSPELLVQEPGEYSVKVYNDCSENISEEVKLTAGGLENVQISANEPFCEGESLKLSASDIPEGASFHWEGPDSSFGEQREIELENLSSENDGVYQFVLEKEGCTVVTSYDLIVPEIPPTPAIELFQNTLKVVDEDVDYSYQWFFEGDTIPGADGTRYEPEEEGEHSVRRLANEICYSDSEPKYFEFWGTEVSNQISSEKELLVYPNPVEEGKFTVRFNEAHPGQWHLALLSREGKEVFQRKSILTSLEKEFTFDVRDLEKGAYLLKITTEKGDFKRPLIIR